jgi:glycine oxidase
MSPDVVVVGGGVIGSSITYQLARRGARVTLFEAGSDGQASLASAGVIAALSELASDALRELAVESARLYPALCADLQERTGIDVGYRASPLMYLATTDSEQRALMHRRDRLARLRVGSTWLDGARAQEVEPSLADDLRGALLFSREHQVSTPTLTLALQRAAADLGATIRSEAVDRLLVQGERMAGVDAGGDTVWAPEVVVAAGAWSGRWAQSLPVEIPVRPVRGQMVGVKTAGSLLRTILFAPDVYLLRKAEGWIYVGATVEEAGFDARPTVEAVRDLLTAAVRRVPALAKATFAHTRAGLRPATPDGLPLLGRLPGLVGASIAAGHFREGVLLAPVTGELIADLVLHRRPRLPLDAFDPARFVIRAA